MEKDTLEVIFGGIDTTEEEDGKEITKKGKVIILRCTVKKVKIKNK